MKVLSIDSKQMAELDRVMIGEYGIELIMMMENAGRALASRVRKSLGSVVRKRILVMVGKGNNGGGGLVAARHLHNWGAKVNLVLADKISNLREAPAKQLRILRAMKVKIHVAYVGLEINEFDVIIDALLGYNQKGNPGGKVAELVKAANSSGKSVIALDVPTGLDPDTGSPGTPCIKATETLTLAIPKKGLMSKASRPYVGRLFLADISMPKELYRKFRISDDLFQKDSIVELEV